MLNAAYANGLLSEHTLSQRLDVLAGGRLIDSAGLIGDLTYRHPRRRPVMSAMTTIVNVARRLTHRGGAEPLLLALDWDGGVHELWVGRHDSCDVRLTSPRVSRRHARLVYREGIWIVHDLESTNGTSVNGVVVGRCRIQPGDEISFAGDRVRID
jgi:hypothetical protein